MTNARPMHDLLLQTGVVPDCAWHRDSSCCRIEQAMVVDDLSWFSNGSYECLTWGKVLRYSILWKVSVPVGFSTPLVPSNPTLDLSTKLWKSSFDVLDQPFYLCPTCTIPNPWNLFNRPIPLNITILLWPHHLKKARQLRYHYRKLGQANSWWTTTFRRREEFPLCLKHPMQ